MVMVIVIVIVMVLVLVMVMVIGFSEFWEVKRARTHARTRAEPD
jgi:hypothetical protein